MANLNLDQYVANKRERKYTAAHIVAKSYLLQQAVEMHRYGSLMNIDPSRRGQARYTEMKTKSQSHFHQKSFS